MFALRQGSVIDAHSHVDKYGEGLARALAQIREYSILTVAVSMDVESFYETRRISESESFLLPSLGIHPWEALRFAEKLSDLDALLMSTQLIGEIGLDRFFVEDAEYYPAHEKVFSYFLDAAEDQGKVVNIHSKGAEAEVLEHLRIRSLPGIIIHWYSGPLDLVGDFLDLGALFTVGVEVLRSSHIQDLVRVIPADQLLTETDNPGGWQWMKGEMGYPELLNEVETAVARVRRLERDRLSGQVRENMSVLLSRGGLTLPEWNHRPSDDELEGIVP